jgi:hypothetical protein
METSRWIKAGVVIALLGLLVTGSIPWVTYYLIDPKFQELKHRPRLIASEMKGYYQTQRESGVEISNGGLLPATGIKVTFQTQGSDTSSEIEITPPSPYTVQRTDSDVTVRLERPLGQGQKVLVIMKRPATAYVYSDEGEVEPILRIRANHPFDRPNFRPENPTRIRIAPAKN